MSAFFLYYHDGSNPLAETVLSAVSLKLRHFSWVRTEFYSKKTIQLVYSVHKAEKIRIFEKKELGLTFILQGNIFESADGIFRIDETKPESSLESQIMDLYLKSGISACVGLNGIYNLFVWDEKKHGLESANDRLGISQVFFAPVDDGSFILTTDILALKSVPHYRPKLSRRGIFDLLYMGVAFEERTILEGVRRLLPNACYRMTGGRLSLLKERLLPFSKSRWGEVNSKLLDELEYLYSQAVSRQFTRNERIVFFQSGEKDSRVYSYFLNKAGLTPQCVTMGERHHGEVFLAESVCRVLGFPWRRISADQDHYADRARDFLATDSFSSRVFSLWQYGILDKIGDHFDVVTSTFLGDPIFGSVIQKGDLTNSSRPEEIFHHYCEFWRKSLCSGDDLKDLFPKEAEDWIAEYDKEAWALFSRLGDEAYQKLIAYAFRSNDRFKVGGVIRNIAASLPVKQPCLDNDLMQFTFSLPPNLLEGRLLLDIFLMRRARRLAALPLDTNSDYYEALVPSLKAELYYKSWSAYVNRVKIPYLRLVRPSAATSQFYVQMFSMRDRGFRQLAKECRSSLSFLEGILDIPKAREILEEELPAGMDHIMPGNRVRSLLTAVLAAEVFPG